MCDFRQINKDFIREFIIIYKQYECLWKIKSDEYIRKDLKNVAYEVLRKKLLEVDSNATIETVKKKINSLRTSYRLELKKVEKSIKSGSGTDDIYKSNLWYYDDLKFLRDQEIARPGISNIPEPEVTVDSEEMINSESFSDSVTSNPKLSRKPRNYKDETAKMVLEKINKKLDKEEDECDVYGKSFAYQLRNVPVEHRIYAVKAINDVLFEASLGNAKNIKILTEIAKKSAPVKILSNEVLPKIKIINQPSSSSQISRPSNSTVLQTLNKKIALKRKPTTVTYEKDTSTKYDNYESSYLEDNENIYTDTNIQIAYEEEASENLSTFFSSWNN